MVRTLLTTDPTYEPGDGGYTNYVGGGYAAGSVDLSPYAIDSEVVHIAGAETITGQKKFGTDTDNSTFEADGTLKFNGAATVEDDINISLVPPQGGAAAPAIIAFNGDARLDCYAFSGTNPTPDEVHSSLEILHGYEEGSDISFHLHWYPTDTTLGNVKWQLRYTWFNKSTVPGAAVTVAVVSATSGVAWQEQTTSFSISGAGKTMGSRFVFSIFRDATDAQDTYAHRAAVTDMGVHYEKDTVGSRTTLTK